MQLRLLGWLGSSCMPAEACKGCLCGCRELHMCLAERCKGAWCHVCILLELEGHCEL